MEGREAGKITQAGFLLHPSHPYPRCPHQGLGRSRHHETVTITAKSRCREDVGRPAFLMGPVPVHEVGG